MLCLRSGLIQLLSELLGHLLLLLQFLLRVLVLVHLRLELLDFAVLVLQILLELLNLGIAIRLDVCEGLVSFVRELLDCVLLLLDNALLVLHLVFILSYDYFLLGEPQFCLTCGEPDDFRVVLMYRNLAVVQSLQYVFYLRRLLCQKLLMDFLSADRVGKRVYYFPEVLQLYFVIMLLFF